MKTKTAEKDVASWPLLLIALPAGVATWSGWVGLGRMTGFGKVQPLPGIADSFTVDTAITLPIGVEAYAAYALGAWLSSTPHSKSTKRFAAVSAVGSLVLGMAGQVAYHLLETTGQTKAPWWIVTLVSCLPVLVLGMGATLRHMLHRDKAARAAAENTETTVPGTAETAPAPVPQSVPENTPAPETTVPENTASVPGPVPQEHPETAETAVPGNTENTVPENTGTAENGAENGQDRPENTPAALELVPRSADEQAEVRSPGTALVHRPNRGVAVPVSARAIAVSARELTNEELAEVLKARIAQGDLPGNVSVRAVKAALGVGYDRAKTILEMAS